MPDHFFSSDLTSLSRSTSRLPLHFPRHLFPFICSLPSVLFRLSSLVSSSWFLPFSIFPSIFFVCLALFHLVLLVLSDLVSSLSSLSSRLILSLSSCLVSSLSLLTLPFRHFLFLFVTFNFFSFLLLPRPYALSPPPQHHLIP